MTSTTTSSSSWALLTSLLAVACSNGSSPGFSVSEGPAGASRIRLVDGHAIAEGEAGAWQVDVAGTKVTSRRTTTIPVGGKAELTLDSQGFVADNGTIRPITWKTSATVTAVRDGDHCVVAYETRAPATAPYELAVYSCADGAVVRTRQLDRSVQVDALGGGGLMFVDDGTVTKVDSATGAEEWSTRTLAGSLAYAVVDGRPVALTKKGIVVLDPSTGAALNTVPIIPARGFELRALGTSSRPHEIIAISTAHGAIGEMLASELAVVDIDSERVVWRQVMQGKQAAFVATGAVAVDRVLVIVGFRGHAMDRPGGLNFGPN